MIPLDAPAYGELAAELAAARRHLAASEDSRTELVKTLEARTLELSSDQIFNAQLLAELKQTGTELKEAARLVRPTLPACASLYDAAAARVRAVIDKASRDRAAVSPAAVRWRGPDNALPAGAASNSFLRSRPASDQG